MRQRSLLTFIFTLLFASEGLAFKAQAAPTTERCVGLLLPEERAFARILHSKNQNFHALPQVTREQSRLLRRGVRFFDPAEKIGSFLKALERIHHRASLDERVKERLRASYYDRFVIKPEDIPESYFEHQQQVALERGHGYVEITHEMRVESIRVLIADQKKSLDAWFDYFLSRDAEAYPFYVKYWSFTSMLKLSKLDLEKGEFLKRSKGTVAPFPELNREALAKVTDLFAKKLRGEAIDADEEWKKLLSQADFGKLYARELKRLRLLEIEAQKQRGTIAGKWIRYPMNSDPAPLVKSLEGKSTGWCTAGEETASSQLSNGDFHVFYSLDSEGKPTVPRVAIRMEKNSVAEIRGVAKGQNLDDVIAGSNILDEKLKEFGTKANRYRKKDADMKLLTEIVKKNEAGEELSKEELRFLYQIDSKIEGFGYGTDPRIAEVISKRNAKKDLSDVLTIKESEVSLTQEEALGGGIRYHYGDLDLDYLFNIPEGMRLPHTVSGDLSMRGLKWIKGAQFPRVVGGDLYLQRLTRAKDVQFPHSVGRCMRMPHLRSAEGVLFPRSVGGDLDLSQLASVKDVQFPHSVGGNVFLYSLRSGQRVQLPHLVEGDLILPNLKSVEGVRLPHSVGGNLKMESLVSAKDAQFPHSVGGNVFLYSLRNAQGAQFPQTVRGTLFLYSLHNTKGVRFPQSIGGLLLINLHSIQSKDVPEFLKSLEK